MGLAIDGNVVHGIAKGGEPFCAISKNDDGSINLNGSKYQQTDRYYYGKTFDFDDQTHEIQNFDLSKLNPHGIGVFSVIRNTSPMEAYTFIVDNSSLISTTQTQIGASAGTLSNARILVSNNHSNNIIIGFTCDDDNGYEYFADAIQFY